jgi:hypothetical protein
MECFDSHAVVWSMTARNTRATAWRTNPPSTADNPRLDGEHSRFSLTTESSLSSNVQDGKNENFGFACTCILAGWVNHLADVPAVKKWLPL